MISPKINLSNKAYSLLEDAAKKQGKPTEDYLAELILIGYQHQTKSILIIN